MIFGIDQIQVAFERVRIHQQVFLRRGQLSFLPVSQYANGGKQKKNPLPRAVPKTKAARLFSAAGLREDYFAAGFAGSDDSTSTAVGIGPLAETGLAMAACWSDSIASFDIRSVNSCKVDMPLDSANWKPDFSEEVMADWQADKQEQFGKQWPEVLAILACLESFGIHMEDVSPSNISLAP